MGTHCMHDLVYVSSYNPYNAMQSVLSLSPLCRWELRPCGVPPPMKGGTRLCPRLARVSIWPLQVGAAFPFSAAHPCGGRSGLMGFSEIFLHFSLLNRLVWLSWPQSLIWMLPYGMGSGICLNFLIYVIEIIAKPISRFVGRNEGVPAGAGNVVNIRYAFSLFSWFSSLWSWFFCDITWENDTQVFPHMLPAGICLISRSVGCIMLEHVWNWGGGWGSIWEMNRGGRALTLLL